jgi:TRAP-type C4-dicarboxylate transport system substrate-binding protein
MDANATIMTSLGAAPVAMPQAEVYDALSKGVLDGAIAVYSGLKT